VQRIFRGPLIWVVIVLIALVLMGQFAGQTSGYTQEPTSKIVQILNGDEKIREVTMKDG